MKDIKFRAWSKAEEKMYLPEKSDMLSINFLGGVSYGGDTWADDMVLMQYTGLKDKNGKEIYELDIVHWTGDSETDYWDETNKVEWIENSTGFYPFIKNAEWRTDIRTVEVIGNAWENPELLKGVEI